MRQQLRVAVVITRFIAGAGGVALRGALAVDPQRYAITVMSADEGPLLAQAEEAGLSVVRLRHMNPEIRLLEDRWALNEIAVELAGGNFDLVHTHSTKAGALGRMAAHRVGVPAVVHTFHGFPFHDFQSAPRRRMYIEAERRLGRITDQFVAVGAAVAAQAVCLKIARPDRICTIASAIEPCISPVTPAARRRARRLFGLSEEERVVGTVGRLDFQKAPLDLIKAIASLPQSGVYGVWVGDGPGRPEVERFLERHGLTGRFLLLGERRDVADLLPGFDVFAMSSLYEGLPCALAEAMTCGIPVVATAVNAVPELVAPGKTGILAPPGDPGALAQGLGYLLDHPAEAALMAAAGRQLVGDRFHPEHLGRDLDRIYQSALGHALPSHDKPTPRLEGSRAS
jgi:glycosyltransferase involved in cell wall biosynthesis